MLKKLLIILLALIALFVAMSVGGYHGSAFTDAIFNWESLSSTDKYVLLDIRLPRVIGAFVVGALLAGSGAMLQALFKNPLADPGIIGISSGASMLASIALSVGLPVLVFSGLDLSAYLLPLIAFFGAMGVAFGAYKISVYKGKTSLHVLLLSGIAFQFLAMSVSGIFIYLSNDAALRNITFWMMGSFGKMNWTAVLLVTIAGLPLLWQSKTLARALNHISIGEENAYIMGTDVRKVKKHVLISTSLAIGASVAFSGIVGFIGLVAPHILRLVFGSDHRLLLPYSLILGGILSLFADTIARSIVAPEELPLSIITALFGAPVLIMLLLKERKRIGS